MKKRIFALAAVLVLCLSLALCASAAPEATFVMDEAGLLTYEEAAELDARLQELSSTYQAQVSVITLSSLDETIDDYIEDVYDAMDMGYGASRDGVLLMVCMDPREYRILTNGMADEAIGSSGIDIIGDNMVSDLSDGYYADAFNTFADDCEYYLNGHVNGFPFDPGGTLLMALIVGIVAGVIVALVLKGQLKSVRQQNRANEYVKPGSMHLTTSHDFFLYRTLDRRKKETNSSSGSSGSSRSVGGGSF